MSEEVLEQIPNDVRMEAYDDFERINVARSEIVARGCEDMLARSEVGREIFNSLTETEQKTLVDKIKEIIQNLKDWVNDALVLYKDKATSYEATALKEFDEELTKLSKLWDEALKDAIAVNQAREKSGEFGRGTTDGVVLNQSREYDFGVLQSDINLFVDNSYEKSNEKDYLKYLIPSERLIQEIGNNEDISEYVHALRDNDIRHIKNSHGEQTNEKYPVTKSDVAMIPFIVENYDKVFYKTNARGEGGIVYVKVMPDNIVYYVESITTEYHKEKLLVNKQMVKTGIDEIPNLYGLIDAINKKQSSAQYLADLKAIRKAYVQDVKEHYSNDSIPNPDENVKSENATDNNSIQKEDELYHEDEKEDIRYSERDSEESASVKEQLKQHQAELASMNVIASINTSKDFKNAREAYEWAVQILKQSGYKAERMGFGTVVFDEKRIQNGLRYLKTKPEYTAYALIPKVIKRGIVVGEHLNHKDRGYNTVTFAAPVEIDGIRGNMAIVVRIEGKNYYKLHRVLMPEGGLFEYKKGSNAERAAATTSVVDTPTDITSKDSISQTNPKVKTELHQDRDTASVYDIMGETERLKRDNEAFKAEIERLKERLALEKKVTGGNHFNENQLGAAAGHLRNISKSTIDKVELMRKLRDVYSYIAQSPELAWEDVFVKCYEIAGDMLDEAKPEVVGDDYSAMILGEIRNTRISLSETQKKEAQHRFGNHWNRNFFGRANITDKGIPLESQWQEWAEMYPDIFNADISEGDMVSELYDIFGDLKNATETIAEEHFGDEAVFVTKSA